MMETFKSELYADPDKRPIVTKKLEQEGSLIDYQTKYRKKNGTEIDCLLNAAVWCSDDGSILGYQGIIRDITEKLHLEDKLQKAQRMEAMGLMAGGIAHDLNNILSGIVSYPELLLMDLPEDSPLRKPMKTIQESGMRAVDVVADLMTIARGVRRITMKTIAMNQSNKGTEEAFPEGSPEGARRATGGEPSAAKISNFSPPDPEVTGKKPRRKFTAKYKLRMLKKADACTEPGQLGVLLRQEGLYSSNLITWRKQRDEGLGVRPVLHAKLHVILGH